MDRANRCGFTLIEILVVIVVIALLATLVAPNVFQHVATAKDATAATGFSGRRGFELQGPTARNAPAEIGGRPYSGHALDQMQNRGLVPSVVENAINTGVRTSGHRPGTSVFYDPINDVTVVTNDFTGRVVTVRFGN